MEAPIFGALRAWVLGFLSHRPRFIGRLISWCTNGPKSYVGGSPHVLAEMERNLWVIRQTPHSSPTEPLEIQTDLHHSPKESLTLRSQGSWVRSPPAAPLLHVPHHTALQRISLWVGTGFLGFSHIESSDLTQTGVGLGRPMLPQLWMPIGAFSTFLGFEPTDKNQNPRGITGLSADGS